MLMITLPGLPMFAHGQIEGFTEKYGMEYKRAYYNETPNQWLMDRHQKEIFPIMRKRYIFSEVENFWIFDLQKDHGGINENVFAYFNSANNEKAFVLFNNKFEDAYGNIFESAPKLVNRGGSKNTETRKISEVLGIKADQNYYYMYKDKINNLEYIKSGQEIVYSGWRVELGGFKHNVFMNFREVYDESGEYKNLVQRIGDSGVPNMKRKIQELRLEPVHTAIKNIFTSLTIKDFVETNILLNEKNEGKKLVQNEFVKLTLILKSFLNMEVDTKETIQKFESNVENVSKVNCLVNEYFTPIKSLKYEGFEESFRLSEIANYNESSLLFLLHNVITNLKLMFSDKGDINKENYTNLLLLDSPVRDVLMHLGRGEHEIFAEMTLLNILSECKVKLFDVSKLEEEFKITKDNKSIKDYLKEEKSKEFSKFIHDDFVRTYLGVNFHKDIWYFSKENFEELFDWLATIALTEIEFAKFEQSDKVMQIKNILLINRYFKDAAKLAGYKLEELEQMINGSEAKKIEVQTKTNPVEK